MNDFWLEMMKVAAGTLLTVLFTVALPSFVLWLHKTYKCVRSVTDDVAAMKTSLAVGAEKFVTVDDRLDGLDRDVKEVKGDIVWHGARITTLESKRD